MWNKIRTLIYVLCIVIVMFLLTNIAHSETLVFPQVEEPKTLDQLITFYSLKYNVKESVMRKVISCESSYKIKAVGDNGKSFGLVQIHQPSHPYITQEQAFDPHFALDFLAKNLAKGKGNMWTCYRLHFPQLSPN